MCRHLINNTNEFQINTIFENNKITFENFSKSPWNVLNDKNLLLRIDNMLFPWNTAAPMIISMLAFKKELPAPIMNQLLQSATLIESSSCEDKEKESKAKKENKLGIFNRENFNNENVLEEDEKIIPINKSIKNNTNQNEGSKMNEIERKYKERDFKNSPSFLIRIF